MRKIIVAIAIMAVSLFANADTQAVFKQNVDSVVIVKSKKLKDKKPVYGIGTGFFVDSKTIATSLHVVLEATEIEIETYDGRISVATVIGYDRLADVVLLSVEITGKPVKLRPTPLQPGEDVIVIGHPRSFFYSMSKGIVSNTERYGISSSLVRYTQIDAAVNPGNSGGPIFDKDGYAVGMAQAIISDTKSFSGMSFIYDSTGLLNSFKRINESPDKVAERPYVGVSYTYVRNGTEMPAGMFSGKGIYVTSVKKGDPAWNGGIRPGDRIVAINNLIPSDSGALFNILLALPVNKDATIVVLRKNKEKLLVITPSSLK